MDNYIEAEKYLWFIVRESSPPKWPEILAFTTIWENVVGSVFSRHRTAMQIQLIQVGIEKKSGVFPLIQTLSHFGHF